MSKTASESGDQRPLAVRLLDALSGIQTTLTSRPLFEQLESERDAARRRYVERVNRSGRALSADPLNEIRFDERPGGLKPLHQSLANGLGWCQIAIELLDLGAGRPFDRAFSGTAQAWTHETTGRVQQCAQLFSMLRGNLNDPHSIMTDNLQRMKALDDWFVNRVDANLSVARQVLSAGERHEARETSTASQTGETPSRRESSVEKARQTAEAIVKKEGWPIYRGRPSIRRLAERAHCSWQTMKKALSESQHLKDAFRSAGGHLEDDSLNGENDSPELARLIAEQSRDEALG